MSWNIRWGQSQQSALSGYTIPPYHWYHYTRWELEWKRTHRQFIDDNFLGHWLKREDLLNGQILPSRFFPLGAHGVESRN